jgi:hypothetical protein
MDPEVRVITNLDLFRLIQSFRHGFTAREHRALRKIKPAIKKWRSLRLWKKLKFWFNEDVRLSIPVVALDLTPEERLSF